MIKSIKRFWRHLFCFLFNKGTEQVQLEEQRAINSTDIEFNETNETDKESMRAKCEIHVIHSPKLGCSEQEYEDAFYIPFEKMPANIDYCKIAIADGATESSFAKEWAEILTEGFSEHSFSKDDIHTTLTELRRIWKTKINENGLPWYAQEKLQSGAFAAFLGLEIDFIKKKWQSLAVGDCCIFLVRDEELLISSPIEKYEDFGNNPYAISSNPTQNIDIEKHFISEECDFKQGDMLILASDAIAAWVLKSITEGERVWETIIDRFENEDFEVWLNEQRTNKQIKNDDTTLILIEF